jgi:hypothetical protein
MARRLRRRDNMHITKMMQEELFRKLPLLHDLLVLFKEGSRQILDVRRSEKSQLCY